ELPGWIEKHRRIINETHPDVNIPKPVRRIEKKANGDTETALEYIDLAKYGYQTSSANPLSTNDAPLTITSELVRSLVAQNDPNPSGASASIPVQHISPPIPDISNSDQALDPGLFTPASNQMLSSGEPPRKKRKRTAQDDFRLAENDRIRDYLYRSYHQALPTQYPLVVGKLHLPSKTAVEKQLRKVNKRWHLPAGLTIADLHKASRSKDLIKRIDLALSEGTLYIA
ncbi:hypothetical protein BJ508DRAFT_337098, partial [Ascobolus immersus RN42]